MSSTTLAVTLVVLSIWVFSGSNVVESAHHGGAAAPAPAVDCSSVIVSMVDCLSYVSAGSTVKKPEGNCCPTLTNILKKTPLCLCEAFKNSAQLGVSLDMKKALGLPAACGIKHAPSVSNCGLSLGGAPATAPAYSPSAMSPGSFVLAPTTGIAPGPVQGNSGSAMLVSSVLTLVIGLLVAASTTASSLF